MNEERMEEIRAEKRAYKREYMRKWRAETPEKVKEINKRYILKKPKN